MRKTVLTEAELSDELLTPLEVSILLGVDPKTVTRWAQAGKLDCIRTIGGHRRFKRSVIMPFLTAKEEE